MSIVVKFSLFLFISLAVSSQTETKGVFGVVLNHSPKVSFKNMTVNILGESYTHDDTESDYELNVGLKMGGEYYRDNIFASIETEFFTEERSKEKYDTSTIRPIFFHFNIGPFIGSGESRFKVFGGIGLGNIRYEEKVSRLDENGYALTASAGSESGLSLQWGLKFNFEDKYTLNFLYRNLSNKLKGNGTYLNERLTFDGKINMKSLILGADIHF